MPTPLVLEGNQVAVGIGVQTAVGTPATTPAILLNNVTSNLGILTEAPQELHVLPCRRRIVGLLA